MIITIYTTNTPRLAQPQWDQLCIEIAWAARTFRGKVVAEIHNPPEAKDQFFMVIAEIRIGQHMKSLKSEILKVLESFTPEREAWMAVKSSLNGLASGASVREATPRARDRS